MKAYLFDFDGTLVDSMPAYVHVMKTILDENGIPYGDDLVKTITPLGFVGTAKYYVTLGVPMTEQEMISRMHALAYDAYKNHIPAKNNVFRTLNALKTAGANLNVLTASPHETLDVCLKRLGLYGLFTNVWSCEDFQTTKADVKIYQMAADRIGAKPEEILFLDDNFNADQTAKAAGMKVCGVYDDTSKEYEEDIRKIADYYIRDFGELLEIIE